jgi:hypothetical protein
MHDAKIYNVKWIRWSMIFRMCFDWLIYYLFDWLLCLCDVKFPIFIPSFYHYYYYYYYYYYFVCVHWLINQLFFLIVSEYLCSIEIFFSSIRRNDVFFFVIFLDELLAEKEKYKSVSDELDMTLNELSGY